MLPVEKLVPYQFHKFISFGNKKVKKILKIFWIIIDQNKITIMLQILSGLMLKLDSLWFSS